MSLQDLLGANPSAQDYLELYAATCAITGAMKAALLAIDGRPTQQAAPLVKAA